MKEKKINKFLGITLAVSLLMTCIFGVAMLFTAPSPDINRFFNLFEWGQTYSVTSVGEHKDFTEKYAGITTVDISNSVSNIEIIPSKTDETIVTYRGTQKVLISQKNQELEISSDEKILAGFGINSNVNGGILTIELAKSVQELQIDSGVGRTSLKDVTLQELEIEEGVGETFIQGVTVGNTFTVSGGVGTIDISDIKATDIDIDGGMGNISLLNIEAKNITIDNGIGNVSIKHSKTDYLSTSKGLGELTIEDVETKYPITKLND